MAKSCVITELNPPSGVTCTPSAGGSLVNGTTYYYKVVAMEATNTDRRCNYAIALSAPSSEVSFTAGATNKQATISWTAPSKIRGTGTFLAFLVFRTTTSGDYSTATAKMLGNAGGSAYPTIKTDGVTSILDTGSITMIIAEAYANGIPQVLVDDGTSVDRIDEDFIYNAYVTQGKQANFAVRTTLPGASTFSGFHYQFTGFFIFGLTTKAWLKFGHGKTVVFFGGFESPNSNTDILQSDPRGASVGFRSAVYDKAMQLTGTVKVSALRLFDTATSEEGYNVVNGFRYKPGLAILQGSDSTTESEFDSCYINSFHGNFQFTGNLRLNNCVVYGAIRLERSGSAVNIPIFNGVTISMPSPGLYSYSSPYVLMKDCSLTGAGSQQIRFHGGSLTDQRVIDLVNLYSTQEPLQATLAGLTNSAGTWFLRRWSLNIRVYDSSNTPIPEVAVSVFNNFGWSELYSDSTAKLSSTCNYASATMSVNNGALFTVGEKYRYGFEVVEVTGISVDTLTVTRARNNTFANTHHPINRLSFLKNEDKLLTDGAGSIPEQYLLQHTLQGDSAQPSPYQYITVAHTPHRIVVRKYGYTSYETVTTVSAKIDLNLNLQGDNYVSADVVTAQSYTGIAIDGTLKTITLSVSHTVQELYDYTKYWGVVNMQFEEPLMTSDGTTFVSDYDLIIETGVSLSGLGKTINLGGNTLTKNGTASSDATIIDVNGTNTNIVLNGLIPGTRVQLYDVAGTTELYNAVVNATTLTFPIVWTTDKLIRIRAMYVSAATAKKWVEYTDTLTQNGLTNTLTLADDVVYNANGIDGSTVTECTISGASLHVDVTATTTTIQRIYAFEVYWLSTATGIRDQDLYLEAVDQTHYVFYGGLMIKNMNTTPLVITGGVLTSPTNNAAEVMDLTGGPIFVNYDQVFAQPTDKFTLDEILKQTKLAVALSAA